MDGPLRAAVALALIAVGCSGGDLAGGVAIRSPDPRSATPVPWEGPPPPSGTGEISIEAFNTYLSDVAPPFATSSIRTALEFLGTGDPEGVSVLTARSRTEEDGTVVVTVVEDRLPDDSVRATRVVIRLASEEELWRLLSAAWTQRCWPGRGHQEFTAELCV